MLGFRPLPGGFAGAAFLQAAGSANDHDLGLFQSPNGPGVRRPGDVGLYHLAWEVGTLTELGEIAERLVAADERPRDTTCRKGSNELDCGEGNPEEQGGLAERLGSVGCVLRSGVVTGGPTAGRRGRSG